MPYFCIRIPYFWCLSKK